MELFEKSDRDSNSPIFSVSELSGALKKTVESAFSNIRLRGEVGRVTRPASGHIYLDIKDENAVINCNIWKGVASGLGFVPEEGMEVIARGKLSTYAPQSKYNFIIESLEIAGEGALLALLEKRKKTLSAEGLFDPTRKKPLPYLPKRIGIITSRTGSVIRDILHRLADRFPVEVILWPVTVQGEKCAKEVTAAIEGFNALPQDHPARPDLLIVARGGGALEDLWGFNEELVVRAVAASQIPLISAIGHETDTTLIDFAADQRAPTPTAAAELAVPVRIDLMASLSELEACRHRALERIHRLSRQRLSDLSRNLLKVDSFLQIMAQRVDIISHRFSAASERHLQASRQRFIALTSKHDPKVLIELARRKKEGLSFRSEQLEPVMLRLIAQNLTRLVNANRLLQALSHQRILSRGFAIIRDGEGKVLTQSRAVSSAETIYIEQSDGTTKARPIKE